MQESKLGSFGKWIKSHKIISGVIIFFILLWILIKILTPNYPETEKTTTKPVEKTQASPYERVTCDKFTKMAKDINSGIVTDLEIREQAKKVYENARYTSFEKTATGLLSAITNNDKEKMQIYYASMVVLCNSI